MSRPQKWLITGGAGYIGAHVADRFLSNGNEVVLYDSLKNGSSIRVDYLREKFGKQIPLIVADIRDKDQLLKSLAAHNVTGVIHLAALKSVSESISNPESYFDVNHNGTKVVLDAVTSFKIRSFLFSSTAAVYGTPELSCPINEQAPTQPISPYGESKLLAEQEVRNYLKDRSNNGTSLRFFNVIGADSVQMRDDSSENLVPIVINKLGKNQSPSIYGTDYPTPDGSCVRDYVDVRDVANAHLLIANSKIVLPKAINLGTGVGVSVREVIAALKSIKGKTFINELQGSRRDGDPASLVADVALAKSIIGYSARYSFLDSLNSL